MTSSKGLRLLCRRTEICTFYASGRCSRGPNCSFAHSTDELHGKPNLSKTKACKYLLKGCRLGRSCFFAHGDDELRQSDQFEDIDRTWISKQKRSIESPSGGFDDSNKRESAPALDSSMLTSQQLAHASEMQRQQEERQQQHLQPTTKGPQVTLQPMALSAPATSRNVNLANGVDYNSESFSGRDSYRQHHQDLLGPKQKSAPKSIQAALQSSMQPAAVAPGYEACVVAAGLDVHSSSVHQAQQQYFKQALQPPKHLQGHLQQLTLVPAPVSKKRINKQRLVASKTVAIADSDETRILDDEFEDREGACLIVKNTFLELIDSGAIAFPQRALSAPVRRRNDS